MKNGYDCMYNIAQISAFNPNLYGLLTTPRYMGGGLKVPAVKEWPLRSTEATEATTKDKYCS